ncbi:MAG: hypothetical protein IPN89_18265 [Saprospiraceae bacterium]|nr:hypothetical protein [Saprospiraceae bacterium]
MKTLIFSFSMFFMTSATMTNNAEPLHHSCSGASFFSYCSATCANNQNYICNTGFIAIVFAVAQEKLNTEKRVHLIVR